MKSYKNYLQNSPYHIYKHGKAYLSEQPPWRAAGDPRLARSMSRVRAPGPTDALRALFFSTFPSFLLRTFPTKPVKVLGFCHGPGPAAPGPLWSWTINNLELCSSLQDHIWNAHCSRSIWSRSRYNSDYPPHARTPHFVSTSSIFYWMQISLPNFHLALLKVWYRKKIILE